MTVGLPAEVAFRVTLCTLLSCFPEPAAARSRGHGLGHRLPKANRRLDMGVPAHVEKTSLGRSTAGATASG